MSENLDLVRSIYAAWERREFGAIEWVDPEIQLVFVDGPDPGTCSGLAEVTRGWREFLGAWEDYRVQGEEFREGDAERVLVLAPNRAAAEKQAA